MMRITWKPTAVGGYATKRFGGWFTGETSATITPDGDKWHLAMVLNGRHEFATFATLAQAKRVAMESMKCYIEDSGR